MGTRLYVCDNCGAHQDDPGLCVVCGQGTARPAPAPPSEDDNTSADR